MFGPFPSRGGYSGGRGRGGGGAGGRGSRRRSRAQTSGKADTVADEKPLSKQELRDKRRRYVREYVSWLKPYWSAFLGIFILALCGVGLASIKPLISALMVDDAILKESLTKDEKFQQLAVFAGILIGAALCGVVLNVCRSLWVASLNARIVVRLRRKLHDHLLHLPLSNLSDMKAGGITSVLSGDLDKAMGLAQTAIISPTVALTQAVVACGIVFWWNWKLALATTAVLPPLVIVHLLWLRKIRPIYRSVRDDRAAVDARVVETFGGIRVVRAFRREPREELDYATGHHSAARKSLHANYLQTIVHSGWELLMPAVTITIMWYGGYLVTQEQATIGQLFAFQWYVFLLLGPIMRIVSSMTQTQQTLAALERVFDVFELNKDKPDDPDAKQAPPVIDRLQFENVHFEYNEGAPVIEDFDLTVKGGSVVALVGPSGAGKSTLTDLIARFYDPTQGRILINDTDVRQLKLASYRQLFAIVQQDVFLFDGTIRDNISYGLRSASDEAIIAAAQRANAHQFINEMTDGYDTIIGERGVKLSGGQRQRISIARAILADPRILILDEATSNLDSESEQLIQSALLDLYEGRTTFVIAHRLSTIKHADLIVVMDKGRIIETGTHDSLLRDTGVYHEMVQRQINGLDPVEA